MLILYNPTSSAGRKPILPMSLLALGAVLEGKHDYGIIDGNLEKDPLNALNRAVLETRADIMGITVMPGPQLNHAFPLCRQLKALHPSLRIIWGGYFPTQHPGACLRSGCVDFVVRGCGELAFETLVETLSSGGDVSKVPSLSYTDPASGEIVSRALSRLGMK